MSLFDEYDFKIISITFGLLALLFALTKNLQGFLVCFIIALLTFFYREIKFAPLVDKNNLPVTSIAELKRRRAKEKNGGYENE